MNLKIFISDIETYKEFFLVGVYIPERDEYIEFEVSRWVNTLDKLVRFIQDNPEHYWVMYNGLRFDSQVLEWIIRNYEKWIDDTNLEIALKIHNYANNIIEDMNYGGFPPYKEEYISFRQLDLMAIWHFNNENRRTSLKSLQFAMRLENIEETPVDFRKDDLTTYDRQSIRHYCKNDIISTYELWKLTIGNTEHKLYKGENKIEDRITMMDQFNLNCLNFDDVKIGAEWNKIDYMTLTGREEKSLKPEKIVHFYGKRFRQFFPKWVSFQTPELKQFIKRFGETFILNKKQEFRYKFNKELTATIAKGGIHSNEKGRFLKPDDDEEYWQIDIGSQYPNAIRKYKVEPPHLPGWNGLIVNKIDRRLSFKAKYKETKDPKFNSLQKMGKLSLNGGSYGRLNTKGDWQEYPFGMLQVTVGGQLEIMMVVEDLILKGFRVVSLNTDGFDCIIKKSRFKEFSEILTKWEEVIGNNELGQFEYTKFEWIAQTSVNHYLAKKIGEYVNGTFKPCEPELKQKGEFEKDKELHKNHSMRIIPIALEKYYMDGIPVEETIRNHKDIYDFCIAKKATRDFHYIGVRDKEINQYQKLIRYYVSLSGEKLYKVKNEGSDSNAPDISQVEAGEWFCTVCNYLPKDYSLNNINYSYYIEKAESTIRRIKTAGRDKKAPIVISNQINLF